MFKKIQEELAVTNTTLVAVSKTKTNEQILEKYRQGQRIFGENRVQELVEKEQTLPKDIDWHLIGHLQTNKVKYIAPFVKLIHSVESLKLLAEIDKQGRNNNRVIPCLLQFKIAEETTKYGFDKGSAMELLNSDVYKKMKNIQIIGVMGMASFTHDTVQVRGEFKKLKEIFDYLALHHFPEQADFKHISMGMSGDYQIAIEEGSTMVRIGSLLFGNR